MDTRKETDAKTSGSASDIPLKVISIPDKEWKEYRNQAPQDELLTLGIGMKLWLAKTRGKAFGCALGMILSIAIGALIAVFLHLVAGIAILVLGYVICNVLSVQRYFINTSFSQTKAKLNVDNKKALDAEFKASGAAIAAEVFIVIVSFTLFRPFAIVLALVSAVLPAVLNTRLVIPEGFGFEALEEIKGYYAEKSFLSEFVESVADYNRLSSNSTRKSVYRDDYGNDVEIEEQAYSSDGKKVYKDKYGNEYYSADGGKTVYKKD